MTIQQLLQDALSTALGERVEVTGAGRTVSGVFAIIYVAHFDCPGDAIPDADKIAYKINAILPKKICLHRITETEEDFHARFSATFREYKYFLHKAKDPFVENFSWWCRYGLDMAKMNEAAASLLGTHDFRCFEKAGGNNLTSICTIYEARWETYMPVHVSLMGYPYSEGDYLVFRIRADRFLRNMVRAIVGTLVDVGRGKRSPESMESLLMTGTRGDAGQSVPGNALFLCGVGYPPDMAGRAE